MKSSENIIEVAKALNELQSGLHTVSKDSKGYNYKYADYASIWNALREPLTKSGLSVVQDANSSPEGVSVTTTLIHTSGQWMEFGPLTVPMGKKDAHSTGSAITYARRYGLSAAVGIVPDDDDGASAQKAAPKSNDEAGERMITEAEHELLEMYLQDNTPLRNMILKTIEERYKVKTLQEMPLSVYGRALESAREQYQCDNDQPQQVMGE